MIEVKTTISDRKNNIRTRKSYREVFDTYTLDDAFPYNKNQKYLHSKNTEDYLKELSEELNQSVLSKSKKDKIWEKETQRVEETKNQNPHPAKVFATIPAIFWDTDVYWLHWQLDKELIVPRMTRSSIIPRGENPFCEKTIWKYATRAADFIEEFYSVKDIEKVFKKTKEYVVPIVYDVFRKRYHFKEIKNSFWCYR